MYSVETFRSHGWESKRDGRFRRRGSNGIEINDVRSNDVGISVHVNDVESNANAFASVDAIFLVRGLPNPRALVGGFPAERAGREGPTKSCIHDHAVCPTRGGAVFRQCS